VFEVPQQKLHVGNESEGMTTVAENADHHPEVFDTIIKTQIKSTTVW